MPSRLTAFFYATSYRGSTLLLLSCFALHLVPSPIDYVPDCCCCVAVYIDVLIAVPEDGRHFVHLYTCTLLYEARRERLQTKPPPSGLANYDTCYAILEQQFRIIMRSQLSERAQRATTTPRI